MERIPYIISCYSERIKRRMEYQLSLNLPMLGPGNRILSSLDHDVTVTCSLTTGGMTQVNTAVFPAITWEWYTFTSYCSLTTEKIIFYQTLTFSFILEYNMSFVFLHRVKWPNKLWVKKNRRPTCLPFSFSEKTDPILIHLSTFKSSFFAHSMVFTNVPELSIVQSIQGLI